MLEINFLNIIYDILLNNFLILKKLKSFYQFQYYFKLIIIKKNQILVFVNLNIIIYTFMFLFLIL